MANTFVIDISLEGKNQSRLAMRSYEKPYTNIPNSALPKSLNDSVSVVYEFLTSESLPKEDYTFLVKAVDGKFKRLFSPAVFSNPDGSGLLIKWGEVDIPLFLKDGKLQCQNSSKHAFKVKTIKVNGWDTVVLFLSFPDANKDIYSMAFPVRPASFENGIEEAELEMHIEEDNLVELLKLVAEPAVRDDSGAKDYSGSGEKLAGPVIKVAQLEVGEYSITAFRRYKNNYGTQHLLQCFVDSSSSFTAEVSSKDESGNWSTATQVIEGPFILKANASINKKLMSDPVITQETPATLKVMEKGEYNGHPFAKCDLEVSAYTIDNELFDVNF